jgi:hypothetical protein
MRCFLFCACFSLFFIRSYARTDAAEENETALVGNFSVPITSQVAPLISFGQLIIGKNAMLPQLSGSYVHAHKGYENGLAPSVIYGILDDLSIFFPSPLI